MERECTRRQNGVALIRVDPPLQRRDSVNLQRGTRPGVAGSGSSGLASQTFTVPSKLAAARRWPSRLNATLETCARGLFEREGLLAGGSIP